MPADPYDALLERAERAEDEREKLVRVAVAEERIRIANEMHDAVSHQVTLIVLYAGALSVTHPDGEVRRFSDDIRRRGVEALTEMRDVLGFLRSNPDATARPARPRWQVLGVIYDLVGAARRDGLDIRLCIDEGNEPLSEELERTTHRIVQEAITNAVKHAPGSSVDITIDRTTSGITISVANTAATSSPDLELVQSGSGTGLIELRQHLREAGGKLQSTRRRDGGFRLHATVPCRATGTIDESTQHHAPWTSACRASTESKQSDASTNSTSTHTSSSSRPSTPTTTSCAPWPLAHRDSCSSRPHPPTSSHSHDSPPTGFAVFSPHTTTPLTTTAATQTGQTQTVRRALDSLTPREHEVLEQIGAGLTNAQIADHLYLSEATIKGHVSRILDKLDCSNRTQAGLFAHRYDRPQ